MKIGMVFLGVILAIAGCSGESSVPAKQEREPGVVDYVIGGPQIKSYQNAKTKLEAIGKDRKENNFW